MAILLNTGFTEITNTQVTFHACNNDTAQFKRHAWQVLKVRFPSTDEIPLMVNSRIACFT